MARKRRRRPVLVVARAYNKRGHLIARAAQAAGKPHSIFLHAEIACLLRAGDTPVHKLTVERYHANGEPATAKPCPICQLAIADWGVDVIEHT